MALQVTNTLLEEAKQEEMTKKGDFFVSKMRFGTMVTLVVLALGSVVWAQDEPPSFGFLDDDVQLRANPDTAASLTWLAPDVYNRLAQYNAIIVEQPEIFLHPESKYKGLKPDALKMLADDFMNALADEVEKSYLVVSTPDEGVLHLRWAIGNVQLKKKWSKNPLKYTPVGATVNAVGHSVSSSRRRMGWRRSPWPGMA